MTDTVTESRERLMQRRQTCGDLAEKASIDLLLILDDSAGLDLLTERTVDEYGSVDWEVLGDEYLSGGQRVLYDLARSLRDRGWLFDPKSLWTLDRSNRVAVLAILAKYLSA